MTHVQLLGWGASRGKVAREVTGSPGGTGAAPRRPPCNRRAGVKAGARAPALQFGVWLCEFADVGAARARRLAARGREQAIRHGRPAGHAAALVSERERVEQEEDYLLTGPKKIWHA